MLRILTLVLLVGAIFASCESDFDPTAPAGSTPYVVCVLSPKDSVQYARVQRSYIARENAYNVSSVADSLYYPQDYLQVFLTRFDTLDESIMEVVEMFPTEDIPKDSGAFSSEGHYLFKTTAPIYAAFEYELSVYFPTEDKRITSRIAPLGARNLRHDFTLEQRKTNYAWYHPEDINYFTDLTPTKHQQLTRFLYLEMTLTDTTEKYIEYTHDYNAFSDLNENFEDQDFLGDDFLLRLIQREVPEMEDTRRIAVGVDFMIHLPDSNLLMYQSIGNPESTFLYKPEYNNIRKGGVGLFASKYKLTLFGKALKPDEVDSISLGRYTRKLNFADSWGRFHDGK